MATATLIGVEEYLSTTYRPDCDYVEGGLVKRHVGTKDHGKLQRDILVWFHARGRELRLAAFPEQRIRVAPRRYRVPDVCVVRLPEPDEQIFTAAPYICIEVLSPDDSFPKLQERLDDYLAMGVPNVWVLDPPSRRARSVTGAGHFEALDGTLRTADGVVSMPLVDLFQPS